MSEQSAPTNSPKETSNSDGSDSESTPFVISLPDDPASNKDWYLWAGVLAIFCLVAFWPAIQGAFIWDDSSYVSQNLALRSWSGLLHIWAPPIQTVQYYPLTYTMFWLEWHAFKTWTTGYHIINLLLHAGSAVLIWRLLRRLAVPGAWVAAALWAVHPLQVESVCWISERKNILSGTLFLASLWYYLKFANVSPDEKNDAPPLTESWKPYAISFGLFSLALFAKTVACSLPVVILLILWWKRKLAREAILGLIPFFILGLALAYVTAKMETSPTGMVIASGPDWDWTWIQRVLIAGRGFWFYIGKLFLPINLSFNYPRIIPDTNNSLAWLAVYGAIAGIGLFAALLRPLGRGPLVAVLFYAVTLFPSLGFFNVYPFKYSFVADHFQYMSGLGLIVLTVAAFSKLFRHFTPQTSGSTAEGSPSLPPAQTVAAILAGVLAVVLAGASWLRADVFTDLPHLWTDTLEKNKDSWFAAYNLGNERAREMRKALDKAQAAAKQGDDDTLQESIGVAIEKAEDAKSRTNGALANPALPEYYRYLCYNTLGEIEQRLAKLPHADVLKCYDNAAAQYSIAIARQKVYNEKIQWTWPDPVPFMSMGILQLAYAQEYERQLPSKGDASTQPTTQISSTQATTSLSATTRSTTMLSATTQVAPEPLPATRPASDTEQLAIHKAMEACDYLTIAIDQGDRAKAIPHLNRSALRDLALAEYNRGEARILLQSLAERRYDRPEADRQASAALKDYYDSLTIDQTNMDVCYKLAKCFEHFDDLDNARHYMLQVIWMSPGNINPVAFNDIGVILIKRAQKTGAVADLQAAIAALNDAIKQRPGYVEARQNMREAFVLWHSATLPSTRSTTKQSAVTQP